MVLEIGRYTGGGPAAAFITEAVDECANRNFSGIAIDTGGAKHSPSALPLSRLLATAAEQNGLQLFVPESLSAAGENAIVRISTALSGGTLTRHMTDAVDKYGAGRVALEIERVCMDFELPTPSGIGKALSQRELAALMSRHTAHPFFSPALGTNYFAYRDKNARFVLFDDAVSIRHKLSLGVRLGIESAFLFYPHVTDMWDEISAL